MIEKEQTTDRPPGRRASLSSITTTEIPLTRLLTADDVAAAYGLSKDRVWELTREGKLPAVKFGLRTYRYRPDRVERAIAEMEE